MSKTIIREMNINDLEETVSLIRKTIIITNSKDYSNEIIENLLDYYSLINYKNMFFNRKGYIALLDGRIIGTVSCEANIIYSLFVDPEYQNKGVGKNLLERVEKYILDRGYKKIELSASLTAVPFYRKNGYVELKKSKNSRLGEVIIMGKNISL